MRVSALLLTLLALTASQSDKPGWEQDTSGGKGCWRNANTGESYGCDSSAGDKAPGSGQDSDKTWDKTAQPPTMPPRPSLPPGAESRPKILCLHGGGMNDEGFRMQAKSLIQAATGLDFVFVSAPNSGGVWIPDPPSSGGAKGASTDANWDFMHHHSAVPRERDFRLRNGDLLQQACVYNSTERTSTTRFGMSTETEMCIAYIDYSVPRNASNLIRKQRAMWNGPLAPGVAVSSAVGPTPPAAGYRR